MPKDRVSHPPVIVGILYGIVALWNCKAAEPIFPANSDRLKTVPEALGD